MNESDPSLACFADWIVVALLLSSLVLLKIYHAAALAVLHNTFHAILKTDLLFKPVVTVGTTDRKLTFAPFCIYYLAMGNSAAC